jgi:hypothetical protein
MSEISGRGKLPPQFHLRAFQQTKFTIQLKNKIFYINNIAGVALGISNMLQRVLQHYSPAACTQNSNSKKDKLTYISYPINSNSKKVELTKRKNNSLSFFSLPHINPVSHTSRFL